MEPIINTFYDHLKRGQILGLRCERCGIFSFPPEGICPSCGSIDQTWVPVIGRGKLLHATSGMHKLVGYTFIQGTVKLEEGPVITGIVLDDEFNKSKPECIWNYVGLGCDVTLEVFENPAGSLSVGFRLDQSNTTSANQLSPSSPP